MVWLAVAVAIVVALVVLSRRRDVVEEPWRDDADADALFGPRRSTGAGPPSSRGRDAGGRVPFSPDPEFTTIPRAEYLSPAAEERWLRVEAATGLPDLALRRDRGQVVLALQGPDVPVAPGRALVDPESDALSRLGLHVFRPRGLSLHEEAIQAADLWAPAPVVLRRVPDDPEFADAIDVCAPAGNPGGAGPLLGTVDREHAAALAPLMDSGVELSAVTLSGPRAGRFGTPLVVLAGRVEVVDALLLSLA